VDGRKACIIGGSAIAVGATGPMAQAWTLAGPPIPPCRLGDN
jgi:hypothetical protein